MEKVYAHILEDNTVNMIVIKEEDLEKFRESSGFTLIGTEGYDPQPQRGWIYNADTDEFICPELPPEEPKEEIDVELLTQGEISKLILKKLGYKVKETK